MGRKVIAVIDWSAAASLKQNVRLLRLAAQAGKVRPATWRDGSETFRSLTLREDGGCELQRFSAAAAVGRLGGNIVPGTARKARLSQRG